MPLFETYIEVPVVIEFDWTEDGPEITGIELRQDHGRTFRKDVKSLPEVALHDHLNFNDLRRLEEEIEEDSAKI